MSQQQQQLRGQSNGWTGMITRLEYTRRVDMLAREKERVLQSTNLSLNTYLFKTNYFMDEINKFKTMPFNLKHSAEIADIELKNSPHKQAWMNALVCKYNDEFCMDKSTQAQYVLLLIKHHSQNYDKFFKHAGLHYSVPELKWTYKMAIQTLNYLKKIDYILRTATANDWDNGGSNSYVNFTTLNHLEIFEGIRDCKTFIDTVSKHMAQHREKMVGILPLLVGHGIDCNIAMIMYEFAC
jgi:hypothetical protein